MSTVAGKRVLVGAVLVALAGVLLLCLVASNPLAGTTGAGAGTGGADLGESFAPFTIEGDAAAPISPVVMASLDLKFTNPHNVPMSVTDLSVRVREVSAPNADDAHTCAVGDFTVDQVPSSVVITLAARTTSRLSSVDLPRAVCLRWACLTGRSTRTAVKGRG